MTASNKSQGYLENDAYTQDDWDEVSDNPDLTDAEIADLRPMHEGLPAAIGAALANRGGRPKSEMRKVPVTIRLDLEIVEAFKATGRGWQTRMNDVLAQGATKLTK